MKRFYFHLKGPDGVETDQDGILCSDLERAYLEACRSLPHIAADIMRARKDPMLYAFTIENEDHVELLTVPFDELVAGHHQERSIQSLEATEADEQRWKKQLRASAARVRRQREIVAILHSRGRDTALATNLLITLEEAQWAQRRFIDRARRGDGTA